jgi:hypothetical protein
MKTISPSDVRRVLTDRREYLAKKKQAAYESGKPFGYESSEIAVIDWVLERVAAKDVPTEEELGVAESLLRTRLGCLNYLSLISNTDEIAPGATT